MLPPAILLCTIVAMIALQWIAPAVQLVPGLWRCAGAPFVAAGLALNLWADSLFKHHGTAVSPRASSTALVEEGPFAFSRNPMYLGMLLLLIGIAIGLGGATPWLAIAVFAWILDARFIAPEESKLTQTFGQRYLEYSARVRRWL
jgi:protein-S-isoprenylcysteine O-methyltransferase Ste14